VITQIENRTCVFELVGNPSLMHVRSAQVVSYYVFFCNVVCVCNLCLEGMSVLAKSFGASLGKSGFDSYSFSKHRLSDTRALHS